MNSCVWKAKVSMLQHRNLSRFAYKTAVTRWMFTVKKANFLRAMLTGHTAKTPLGTSPSNYDMFSRSLAKRFVAVVRRARDSPSGPVATNTYFQCNPTRNPREQHTQPR
jgi:hypothetical protein